MKKIFLTLLVVCGLFFSTNAFAVPVLGGENPDLQEIFDNFTVDPIGNSSIDVTTDFLADTSDSTWSVSGSGSSIATMVIEVAGWATENVFGIYNGNQKIELFNGAAASGSRVLLTIYSDFSVEVNFFDTGVDFNGDSFGFYIENKPGDVFYSDTSLNADSVDHMFAYQGNDLDEIQIGNFAPGTWTSNEWILAFEDTFGGGDWDYQDMVIMIESVEPVPEPSTLLLFGSGLLGLAFLKRRKQ